MKRRAFTLIEVMLAVAVMALLASLAAWSFAGPLKKARGAEAVEQLRLIDASSRAAAKRSGRPVRVSFDLADGVITRRELNKMTMQVRIEAPLRIEAVHTPGRRTELGRTEIDIAPPGASVTYAVCLVGGEDRRWVVFTGLGGQSIVTSNEKEIDSIFARLSAGRHAD